MNRCAAWLLAFALLLPAAPAKDKTKKKPPEPDDPGKGVNFYSLDRELAMGRGMAQEVERESRLLDDSVVAEYINRIGQNVVRNSDAKLPFTIKVIDSEEINAFALPGGFLFVDTGLVLRAENEAELAGVMAHEVAHVAARHGTRQASRAQIVNYASIPLIFVGGWAGYAVREIAALAVPMGFLQFSRAFEAQADYLGLQYVDRSGYDPTAFVDFFEKIETLEKRQPGAIARAFSSHPMTSARIRNAQKQIQNDLQARPQYVLDTSEFHDVKARLASLQNRRAISQSWSDLPVLKKRPRAASTEPDEDQAPRKKN
ncbi:MAG TPA: M48 family metallopeptidase [Candidatus Sulfopaludibacter sp.]|nr:M48 family metallopeptidase [Candidatus Sulfopaludibacter sp.]